MSKYVGQSFKRKEDYRLLTGTGNFVADMKAANMVEASFIRSTHAHALIKNIDTTAAKELEGVLEVITAKDIEGEIDPISNANFTLPKPLVDSINPTFHACSEEILAKEKVVYVGQPIAVVLAENRYIAEDAASLVKIDYDPLPAIMDPFKSMKEETDAIHPYMESNVQGEFHVSVGNIEEAFENADHILNIQIKVPRVCANPIETRGVFTSYDSRTEQLTMWSSTQVPYRVRSFLSKLLHLVEENIRVVAPDVGGGFGLKDGVFSEEILLGYLSIKYKRPMKWVEDRLEHLTGSRHSRDQVHNVKVALMGDGTITCIKDNFVLDHGAYNPLAFTVSFNTASHLRGIFKVPNYDITAKCVLTNKAPGTAYRGAGRPEAVFTMDRIIYHAAKLLGVDPVEIMTKNMIQPEDMPHDTGIYYRDGEKVIYDSGDYPAGLKQALEMVEYDSFREQQQQWKAEGKYIGIGISSYIEGTGIGPYEGALIRLDSSGQIMAYVGSSPQGQSHETTLSQICADEFGVSPEQVTVKAGDTALLPHGVGTFASRSAVVAGSAVQVASQKLREKLLAIAGEMLEIDAVDLEMSDGKVYPRALPNNSVTLQEIALAAKPGPNSKAPEGMESGTEASHYFIPPTVTYSSGFHVAVVEIDKETGFLNILRYIVVHDCGKVLNPMVVDGQIQGGVAQGIGEAIYEEIVYDENGQLLTGSYMDYLLPTSTEVPKAEIGHQESLSTRNQSGIKGVGEGGAISPLAAVANAISDALSPLEINLDELPVSPNRLFQLIKEAEEISVKG